MKFVDRALVAVVLGTLAMFGLIAPTSAQDNRGSTSVAISDFVYQTAGCHAIDGLIAVPLGGDYFRWQADVTTYGPGGEEVSSDTVSAIGTEASFNALHACFYLDDLGYYDVYVHIDFYDRAGLAVASTSADGYFSVLAGSSFRNVGTTAVSPGWKISASLKATGNIAPTRNHAIRLQRLISGKWSTVDSVRDGAGGRITIEYVGPSGGRFRLKWSGTELVAGAESQPFRLLR